jgi:transcriptional regulator with XRE-family HTH domain
MTYSDAIAIRISQVCLEKKITLNKLATLSGLRQSTLDNIVKGNTKNPTLKTLHRIAVGLDITVSELLNFDEMNETVFEDE